MLGFPNVEARHPRKYIKELGIPMESARNTYPRFMDYHTVQLGKQVNAVVRKFSKDDDRLRTELSGGNFLEKDVSNILCSSGYGQLIWGSDGRTGQRWKTVLIEPYPRWNVDQEK